MNTIMVEAKSLQVRSFTRKFDFGHLEMFEVTHVEFRGACGRQVSSWALQVHRCLYAM